MATSARKPFIKEFFKTTRSFEKKTVSSVLRHETVTVTAYHKNDGYGFARCDDGTTVFFDKFTLSSFGIHEIYPTNKMEVDLGKSYQNKDQLRVRKIFSVSEKEYTATGSIMSWGNDFGFIAPSIRCIDTIVRTPNGANKENIYVPVDIITKNGLANLKPEQNVIVKFHRKGQRFIATNVQVV